MTQDNSDTVTEISELTCDTKSRRSQKTTSTTGTGSESSKYNQNKWVFARKNKPDSSTFDNIKGSHPELRGKVFTKGALQASRYDDAYKAILIYVGTKFDHRVFKALEYKDRTKCLSLLSKPKAPMVIKVIQVVTIREDSKIMGKEVTFIDKDGEAYSEYSLYLKQYMTDLTKFNSDLEKAFSIIIGQCSPAMEQSLAGEKEFKNIKETSETIGLIKMIERICCNYQSHEFGPLGVW